jgi:acetyl-CoA synthetase
MIWTPGREQLERSNVAAFMQRHKIATIDALIDRSRADIEWFWGAMERELGLEWFEPYRQVVETSRGIPWATWFVGGKINLAHNCVDRHARSGRLACIWEGEDGAVRSLTFAQLAADVGRLANALRARGVRKGDLVGLYLPLSPEAMIASFAVAKIGAIYTPIFSGYGAAAVADRLEGCKVLISQDAFLRRGKWVAMKEEADQALAARPEIEHHIVVRRSDLKIPWDARRDLWWHEETARRSPACETERTDAEDPFLVIYTSGTTGRPKGAVHVHGGFLVKVAEEAAMQTDVRGDDVLFWFTDMGWIMGPWELVGAWARGATVVAIEGAPDFPTPDRLWRVIERHRVSILGISPTAIRALRRYGDPKQDLSRLRIVASTGEPWDPESWRWYFEKIGGARCPLINLSGGTEVGACFLSPHPVQPLRPCSLGGPALGMDVDVVDDNARPVRGAVGELVCRKPWPGMTRGCWKDPERYLETYWSRWPNVWYHGDFASIDEAGQWYLHGRSDDTIKVAGKRVGPAEVESALATHPAVAESAAIGVPDELKGESIVCFVVTRGEVTEEALLEHAATQMGKAMKPKAIRFVTQLPKTRSAKVLRRMIRAVYLGQLPGDTTNLENPAALDEIKRPQ